MIATPPPVIAMPPPGAHVRVETRDGNAITGFITRRDKRLRLTHLEVGGQLIPKGHVSKWRPASTSVRRAS